MCYHKSLSVEADQLEAYYNAALPEKAEFGPVYHANAFHFPTWPILTRQEPGQFQYLQWGLVPRWVRSRDEADEIRARTLNAKSETIFDKPSFRGAAGAGQRCLIPVTGFYEWYTKGKQKFPFFIQSKKSPIFSIAGIWDEWTDRDTGEVLRTYSLLTSEANPLLARIHNTKKRMPVMLTPELEKAWLHDDLGEKDALALVAKQYPDSQLHSYSIGKLITSRTESSDVPEVQQPAQYPELEKSAELFA
jgi:putative SOS response-associated peptidase YedK